jgi:hypothetical protein
MRSLVASISAGQNNSQRQSRVTFLSRVTKNKLNTRRNITPHNPQHILTMTMMLPSLVPIRIDVFASDKSLRIVETLLLDPTVWPIPFPRHSNGITNDDTDASRAAWIESNCQLLANQVLADQECVGMGRTARHFTGRVELWSDSMQCQIADQIRPQLEQVALGTTSRQRPLLVGKVKRKASAKAADSSLPPEKKVKIDNMEIDTPEKESSNADAEEKPSEEQPKKEDTASETTAPAKAEEKKADETTSNEPTKLSSQKPFHEKSRLIPIRLRLLVHGVRIHDDFDWDPCLGVSPLELAQTMGRDLQLSDEAVVALAIDIAEQIHGLSIVPDEPGMEEDEGGPPDRRNTTAAWPLEQRLHITNVAHLVAQHRHK